MPASPRTHQSKERFESLAVGGQRVVHFRRDDGIDLSMNNSVPFKVSQLLRQHFLGGLRYHSPQLTEPHHSIPQVQENGGLSVPSERLEGGSYRTVGELHGIFVDT